MNTAREVKKVILHLHLDEAFAYFLAYHLGQKTLTGIQSAEVLFPKWVQRRTLEEWIKAEELCLGGYGDFCDEHRSGATARIQGTCAAGIMADYLELPPCIYRDALREVNFWDNNKGCPKAHLGSIFKMIHNNQAGFEAGALKWAMKVMLAVVSSRYRGLPRQENEEGFLGFMTERVDRPDVFTDEDARASLLKHLAAEDADERHLFFGLKSIFEALWRTSSEKTIAAKRREVSEDMRYVIQVLYNDQVNFHAYRRTLKNDPPQDMAFTMALKGESGEVSIIRGAAVQTDVPVAHSVIQSLGYQVSIVKNTAGNVSIMCDQDELAERGLSKAMQDAMRPLAAMCRYRDMAPEGRRGANWDVLSSCLGDCPADTGWYLPPLEWLALYKGTANHFALPTSMKLADIKGLVKIAVNPDDVITWKQRNGVIDFSAFMPVTDASSSAQLAAAFDAVAG